MNANTNYKESLLIESYLKNIGVPIDSFEKHPKCIENGSTILDKININPESTGSLSPMFKRITLSVSYETFEREDGTRITRLNLDYKYEHPSGSNGYSVNLYSTNLENFKDRWD